MAAERFDLKNLAGTLAEVVEKSFRGATPVNFSDKPAIEIRDIIEYDGRMRVSGMEIFNGPTYISAVNFYRSAKETKTIPFLLKENEWLAVEMPLNPSIKKIGR